MAPIIKTLIIITLPVCYPISKALDYFLGDHKEKIRFGKKDLKTLMQLHMTSNAANAEGLSAEEIRIINSTLDIRNIHVFKIMVPIDKAFKLTTNTQITIELIEKIQKRNYSKIPIFDPDNSCVGILKAKSFINAEKFIGKNIKDIKTNSYVVSVARNTNLLEALRLMQDKKVSVLMLVDEVKDKKASVMLRSRNDMLIENTSQKCLGFVFLKDIFEEIVKAEIEDQDVHIDSTIQQAGMIGKTARTINTHEARELKESKKTPLL